MSQRPAGSVHLDRGADGVLITFVGEIDQHLEEQLRELRGCTADGGAVHVDCSQVTFFAGAAIHALADLGVIDEGGCVSLVGTSRAVDLTLAAAGFTVRSVARPPSCGPARRTSSHRVR